MSTHNKSFRGEIRNSIYLDIPFIWSYAVCSSKLSSGIPYKMLFVKVPQPMGGRHIDFGVDTVGVYISFGVGMTLSCLHNIF